MFTCYCNRQHKVFSTMLYKAHCHYTLCKYPIWWSQWPLASCWLRLACEVCLAHGWHVWHATAGCFWYDRGVCDWQAVFLVSPYPETAISPKGCFQSLPAPYPSPLSKKVKLGPSVTDQRAGPSSWWPSTAVKMSSSPSPITCLGVLYSYLSYGWPDRNHKVCISLNRRDWTMVIKCCKL